MIEILIAAETPIQNHIVTAGLVPGCSDQSAGEITTAKSRPVVRLSLQLQGRASHVRSQNRMAKVASNRFPSYKNIVDVVLVVM
jgi:hypothetical protein